MATVERPEIEIVEGEVPAVAVEVAEAAVPSPKASGPIWVLRQPRRQSRAEWIQTWWAIP